MGELNQRFELDAGCRLADRGRILIGGSPLTLFRLSEAGQRCVARIAAGAALEPGHEPLTSRLLAAGAIHPLPDPGRGPTPADVTLVIPARNADPTRLARLASTTGAAATIVVDDASVPPIGPVAGAHVVRLEENVGPGGARQRGLELVTTPFVAFLDTDVDAEPEWLVGLLPHLDGQRVALVAPRVRAAAGGDVLTRFEALRNPLDLGPLRARIRAGTRVSYVPGAALVCRVAALNEVGGFAPGMRLGEDVDLVWRLDAAGWTCRYEPGVEVRHDVRPALGPWLRQRMAYGRSATDLARRHPGAMSPVRVSAWSAAAWTLPVLGAPVAGLAVAAGSTAALVAKLPPMDERGLEALRLAGLGHVHAGRLLAGALTREWWPAALVLALASRRARRVLLAAAVVPSLIAWWRVRRGLDPARYLALRLLDDGAYGAGVWAGAVEGRSPAALVPDLTSWPNRGRYDRRSVAQR